MGPPEVQPTANTRLLDQFSQDVLGDVTAWFWGHEHASTLFKPYAGLQKGRLIGNACIPVPKPPLWNAYSPSSEVQGMAEWGGDHPDVLEGSKTGTGDLFWSLGFVTLEISGNNAKAKYFELQDYNDG